MARVELPRDEMAFRKIYRPSLEAKTLTTVFRPGSRLNGDFRGYDEGEVVKARILEKIGADWANVAPEFVPDFEVLIRIIRLETKRLGELTEEDFEGSSPDVHNRETLQYHLGIIYNLSSEELGDDLLVTRINFDYVN